MLGYFHKGILPRGNFPILFSQVATSHAAASSQVCLNCSAWPPSMFVPQLGPYSTSKPQCSASIAVCCSNEGLNIPLGSCRLRNYYLGRCQLGNCNLGSRHWVNAFVKMTIFRDCLPASLWSSA